MTVPTITHRQRVAFDEGNRFLGVVLGLLALTERIDGMVGRHVPPPGGEAGEDVTASPALDVLLGIVSLTTRLRHALAVVELQSRPAPARPAAGPVASAPRDLLT
jgi:hypothetical protein